MTLYDFVIHGGRVIDGTGNPWLAADLAVKDGKIAAIGNIDPTSGQRAISAKGLVVAPGFIDLHTHSDQPLVADGNAESKVRQGVTLDIIGESQTVAPLEGAVLEEYRAEHRRRNAIETDWTNFAGYFERLTKGGVSINVASGVSPQQIKTIVVGFDERPATAKEHTGVDPRFREGEYFVLARPRVDDRICERLRRSRRCIQIGVDNGVEYRIARNDRRGSADPAGGSGTDIDVGT